MSSEDDDGTQEIDNSSGHLTVDDDLSAEDNTASDVNLNRYSSNRDDGTGEFTISDLELEDEFQGNVHLEEPEQNNVILKFVKKELPFIYKLISKILPGNTSQTKVASSIKNPSNGKEGLGGFFAKFKKKDNEATLEHFESEAPSSGLKKIKPIHIIILVGIIGILSLPDGEDKSDTKNEDVIVEKTAPVKKAPKPTKKIEKRPEVISEPEIVEEATVIKEDPIESEPPQVVEKPNNIVVPTIPVEKVEEDLDAQLEEELSRPVEKIDLNEKEIGDTEVNAENQQEIVEATGEGSEAQSESDLEADIIKVNPNDVVDISISGEGTDISTKILQDLEKEIKVKKDKKKKLKLSGPVAPPSYEYVGEGLVYNCIDGHWACVDKASHQTCELNYAWNSTKAKPIECYPMDLYEFPEACEYVQQTKINSITTTSFCNTKTN